jgi:hypothetical protein
MNTLSDPRYFQALNAASVPHLNLNGIHKEQPLVIGRKIQSVKTLQTKKAIKKKPENLIKDKRQFKARRDISVPMTDRLRSVPTTERLKPQRTKSKGPVKTDKPKPDKKPNELLKTSPPPVPRTKRGTSADKRRQPSQAKQGEGKVENKQTEVRVDKNKESNSKCQELISKSLKMFEKEKKEQNDYENLRMQEEAYRREKFRNKNEEIRLKNAKHVKSRERLHVAPWGVDQKVFNHEDQYKDQELELLKIKRRDEREKTIQQGRTRIGLDLIPDLKLRPKRKSKSRERKTEEKQLPISRNTNNDIKKYMKQKRREMKIAELLRLKEELEREARREKELEELDNKQKKLVRKTSRKRKGLKSHSPDEEVKMILSKREPSEHTFEYRGDSHRSRDENKHGISDLQRKSEVEIPAPHFSYIDKPTKQLSKPDKLLKERVENIRNAQINSIHLSAFNSSENMTHHLLEEGKSDEESKIAEAMQRSRDMLLRRLQALKDRVHSTGLYLRTEDFNKKESAASKIQKWWRASRERQRKKQDRNYSQFQQESMTKTEFSILKALLKHEERVNAIKRLRRQSPLPEYSAETPNSQDESLELPNDAKSIDLEPREDTHHPFELERSDDFVKEEDEDEEQDWQALLEPEIGKKSDLVEKFRESLQHHYQELEKKLQENQINVQAQLDELGSHHVEESLLRTLGTDRFGSEGSGNFHNIIRSIEATPTLPSSNSGRNPPKPPKSNIHTELGLQLDIDTINRPCFQPPTIEDEKEYEQSSSQVSPTMRFPIQSIEHFHQSVISIQSDKISGDTDWIFELDRRSSQRSITRSAEKLQTSDSNFFDSIPKMRLDSKDSNAGNILIEDEESEVMGNASFQSNSRNHNLRYNFDEGEELHSFTDENQISEIPRKKKYFDFSHSDEDELEENSGYLEQILKKNLKIDMSDYQEQFEESYNSADSKVNKKSMQGFIPDNQDISPILRNEQIISSKLVPVFPEIKANSQKDKIPKVPMLKLELINQGEELVMNKPYLGSTSSIDKSSISYDPEASYTSNFLESIPELKYRKETSLGNESSQESKVPAKLDEDKSSSFEETKSGVIMKLEDRNNRVYIPRLKIPTLDQEQEAIQSPTKISGKVRPSIPKLEDTSSKNTSISSQEPSKRSEEFKPFLQRIEEKIKSSQAKSTETSKEEEKSFTQTRDGLQSLLKPTRVYTSPTDSFHTESVVNSSDISSVSHNATSPEISLRDLEVSVEAKKQLPEKKPGNLLDSYSKPIMPKLNLSSLGEPELKLSTKDTVLKSIQIIEYQLVPKISFNIAIVQESIYNQDFSFESYKHDKTNSQSSVDIDIHSSYENGYKDEPIDSIHKSELFEESSPGTIFSNQKPAELQPLEQSEGSSSYQDKDLTMNQLDQVDSILNQLILTEIDNYIIPNFHEERLEVDSSLNFVENYLRNVENLIEPDKEAFLDIYNSPMPIDFLQKLTFLQNAEIGALVTYPSLELILPPEINDQLKEIFANSSMVYRRIYCQMLFDCLNEALNYVRPYGINGEPAPWSRKERTVFGEENIHRIFERAIEMLKKWANIKAGHLPTPEVENIGGLIDEAKLQQLREERLSALLCSDVYSEEKKWIDYEDEEVQAQFDLADILLEHLVEETAGILDKINE